MNKCFKCGAEFQGNFCPQCGAKFETTKTCPQCNTQLDGQTRFCNNCGYNFVEDKPVKQSKPKKQVGKAVKNFAQKSKAWLVAHKTLAIIVAAVILVGIVLAIVLPLTVGNIFRANKVAKINVGDDVATVERILGKPYEIENNNVYYYYSKNIAKKMDEMKKLDELMDSITSFGELEKLAEKEEKLESEMAAMVFSRITVKFSSGKVYSVEMDTQAKVDDLIKEIKWQADGNKKQKVVFVPNAVPYGLTPDMIDIVAKIYYADGSYKMNEIHPESEGDSENGWTLTWRDYWGEYSWQIYESTDKSNVIYESYRYLILETDKGDYALTIKQNIGINDVRDLDEFADKITAVYVSQDVTSIYSETFRNFTGVILEEYEGGVYLGSTSNPYQSLWKRTLPSDIKSFTIHPDTQTVMNGVFRGCTSITQINVPDNVSIIGDEAFSGCTGLEKLSLPDGIAKLGTDVIANCNKLIYNTYDNANYLGNDSNPYVVLVKTTVSDITSCSINEHTKFVMPKAFFEHTNLTSITIPNGVVSIEASTFEGCDSLASVTMPDSVTRIGHNAFKNCTALASVTLPDSVTHLGNSAFSGCSRLVSIKLSNSLTTVPDYTFFDCSSLTNVDIPGNVTHIGFSAFANCSSLREIVLPNSVESAYDSCFENCTSLERVTLSENIGTIGDRMFYGCVSLKSITIPQNVYSIGTEAFSGCTGLSSVTIPQNVTAISARAFYGCTNLTSVTFKKTKGWYYVIDNDGVTSDGDEFSSKDIANATTAAKLLTGDYVNYEWSSQYS